MMNSWLPTWLGVVWVALMVVVAVVHVRHLLTLPDVTRAWHAGHVLMASGMAVMFWPGGALLTPGVGVVGRTVFVLAALAAAAWAVVDRRRRGSWTTVWPLLALDLGAMVWMFAVMAPAGTAGAMGADGSMSMGPWWVNALLAAWFAVEAVRWATGSLVRSVERDLHLELPGEVLQRADAPTGPPAGWDADGADGTDGADGASTAVAGPEGPSVRRSPGAHAHGRAGEAAPRTPAGAHAWHGTSLRVTLTIMSAGMAYMLAAMAFGASSMGGMGGMGGM